MAEDEEGQAGDRDLGSVWKREERVLSAQNWKGDYDR